MSQSAAELGFDPDALKAKYRAERDKRLRDDANEQYVEIAGAFAHYLDDPYVEPGFTRAPLTDEVDVVVIGGGFGGLLTGARLREAGVKSVRIIEKGEVISRMPPHVVAPVAVVAAVPGGAAVVVRIGLRIGIVIAVSVPGRDVE